MKLIVFGLLVSVCYAGSPSPSPKLAPISLFTQLQQPAPAVVMAALREEAAGILAPAGFHFEWHDLSAAGKVGTSVELAVVIFHGACDVPNMIPGGSDSIRALGYTNVTNGEILPFITVDCEKTQSFLASALSRVPVTQRERIFGRALGRILAHELFHVFAKTQRHAHAGLTKESYTVEDLVGEDLVVEESDFDLLRSSPAYLVLSQPRP